MQILLRKALLVSAFFIAWQTAQAACEALPVSRRVQIVQVIDGDTVRLDDGNLLRLIGINTPEIGRGGRADESGARQAKRRLADWIEGRQLEFTVGLQPRDHYGRMLGYLSLGGVSVAEQLIEEGLGVATAMAPDRRLSDCLFAAEARARQARLGMWRRDPVRPATAIRRSGFALVRGRVTRVDQARDAWLIELDDHLVLKLDQAHLADSVRAPVAEWAGRVVEARGWVIDREGGIRSEYKRWLINLSDQRHLQFDLR